MEAALLATVKAEEATISSKLLVWDLLTVAFSDENYNDSERRLLKYIVRKLNLDKASFLEMESSSIYLSRELRQYGAHESYRRWVMGKIPQMMLDSTAKLRSCLVRWNGKCIL